MINDNNSLDNFTFGMGSDPEPDFFSQQEDTTEVKTDAQSVIEQISQDDITATENNGKEGNQTPAGEKEDDLFSNFKDETGKQGEEEEEEENENGIDKPNVFVLNQLKEKGFLNYELEDGEELTEELAGELLEEKFDESVEERIKELADSAPDENKEMIQFLMKGGNLAQFINSLTPYNASIDVNVDLEVEENQLSTMKKLLKLEDKDDEEIEAELEFLKDSGKLKAMTEKKFGKYKAEFDKQQKELIKAKETAIEEEKKAVKEAKQKATTFLSSTEELGGIKFSKDDKKALPSYMNDKVVKLQNGSTITQMQKELWYDLPKNEKALIQLATLLKNRNEDGTFNFDSIAKNATTKVAQAVRQEIRRDKSSIPGSSTKTKGSSDKTLADYFNN